MFRKSICLLLIILSVIACKKSSTKPDSSGTVNGSGNDKPAEDPFEPIHTNTPAVAKQVKTFKTFFASISVTNSEKKFYDDNTHVTHQFRESTNIVNIEGESVTLYEIDNTYYNNEYKDTYKAWGAKGIRIGSEKYNVGIYYREISLGVFLNYFFNNTLLILPDNTPKTNVREYAALFIAALDGSDGPCRMKTPEFEEYCTKLYGWVMANKVGGATESAPEIKKDANWSNFPIMKISDVVAYDTDIAYSNDPVDDNFSGAYEIYAVDKPAVNLNH